MGRIRQNSRIFRLFVNPHFIANVVEFASFALLNTMQLSSSQHFSNASSGHRESVALTASFTAEAASFTAEAASFTAEAASHAVRALGASGDESKYESVILLHAESAASHAKAAQLHASAASSHAEAAQRYASHPLP
jgi:hypothetical protein